MKDLEFCPISTVICDKDDHEKYTIYTIFSNIGCPDDEWETHVSEKDENGYCQWIGAAYAKNRDEAISQHMKFVRKYLLSYT